MQLPVYGSPSERQQPRDPAELGNFDWKSPSKKGILITGGGLHREETKSSFPKARSRSRTEPFLEGKELIAGSPSSRSIPRRRPSSGSRIFKDTLHNNETRLVQIFGLS